MTFRRSTAKFAVDRRNEAAEPAGNHVRYAFQLGCMRFDRTLALRAASIRPVMRFPDTFGEYRHHFERAPGFR
jgi:hypothetical protein